MVDHNCLVFAPHDSCPGYPMHSLNENGRDCVVPAKGMSRWLSCLLLAIGLLVTTASGLGGELDFAHGLYRQKRFELAAEEYANYLQTTKDGSLATEARFFLAESYVQLKREADALPLFMAVIEEAARSPGKVKEAEFTQSLFRAGQINFNRKQFDEASKNFKIFLERFPDHPLRGQAIYLLAESRLERSDAAGAAEALQLESSSKIEPSLLDYLLLSRAKLAEQQNKPDDALAAYHQVIEHLSGTPRDPRLGEAYYRLGLLTSNGRTMRVRPRRWPKDG